jgi:hypothetical protein
MKLSFLIIATTISPLLAGELTITNDFDSDLNSTIKPGTNLFSETNLFFGLQPPAGSGFVLTNLPNLPTLPKMPNFSSSTASALKPGIYRTEPFACMVKIPGPQHDDNSIQIGGWERYNMPTAKPGSEMIPNPDHMPNKVPDLKLIPESPDGK